MYLDHPHPASTSTSTSSHTSTSTDPFFSSRPSSPSSTPAHESRDTAQLQRTHTTSGYRDGIAHGKTAHLQAGFDEGYTLGARFGRQTGWVLGVAEGLRDARLLAEAAAGLALEVLFGTEYFDAGGVWRYDVGDEEGEGGGVTLDVVVERHPLVVKWVARVRNEAARRGLVVVDMDVEGERERERGDGEGAAVSTGVILDGTDR